MCLHFSEKSKEEASVVLPTGDQCCLKLHESLQAVKKELVTHIEQSLDMFERTTRAFESMAKSKE